MLREVLAKVNKMTCLEVELPEGELENRRISFYERNGFKRAKCGISFFGINLEIMCNKGEFRKSEFEKVLTKIKIKAYNIVFILSYL